MNISQAINEMLLRPDSVMVLMPDRVFYLGQTNVILDGSKVKRTYPRMTVRDLAAGTWEVLSRGQWVERCELIARELAAAGVSVDNG